MHCSGLKDDAAGRPPDILLDYQSRAFVAGAKTCENLVYEKRDLFLRGDFWVFSASNRP